MASFSFKLDIFRQRRADEEPALIKAKDQISSMINEVRDFKKEQATLTNELEQLKFKKSEYTDKLVNFLLLLLRNFICFYLESNKFLVVKCETRMQQAQI